MTDLNKERNEFEAIETVSEILKDYEICFSELHNRYYHSIYTTFVPDEVHFLNGGWYAWQEKAKAQAVPEWISVDDKWPEYGQSILVVINGLTQTRVFYRDGSDCSEDWIEPVNDEDKNNIWWNKVTFWMPLPKAPSKSGDEG